MNKVISFIRTVTIIAVFAMAVAGAYALGRDKAFTTEALQAAHTAQDALREQAAAAEDRLNDVRHAILAMSEAIE